MIIIVPIVIGGITVTGVKVKLPKTTLLATNTPNGYIMCGAHNM
ncbi:hypothetical protein [Paenibacillus antarcticus]